MNEFRTQDEQEAFEDEAMKISTGDRKQDVMDIWFAARYFFEKPSSLPVSSALDPNKTQVFELTSEDERKAMGTWADLLDAAGGTIRDNPEPLVSVGDILVRRPNGFYEVFRSFNDLATLKEASSATARNGEYRRMEILRILGHASTQELQEIDDWVSGGQSD